MSAEASSSPGVEMTLKMKQVRFDLPDASSIPIQRKADDGFIRIHREDVERMILYGKAMALINLQFQKVVPTKKHPPSSDKAGWVFDMMSDYEKMYELYQGFRKSEMRIMYEFKETYDELHDYWDSDDER